MKQDKNHRRREIFDFESATAIGEIKSQPKAIRQIRDALVKLIKRLVQSQEKSAFLVLIDPQITQVSLDNELGALKEAMRPEIATRLHLVVVNQDEITGLPADILLPDYQLLKKKIDESVVVSGQLPRPDMQSEVLRVLVHQWALGRGAMTFDWLSNTVGCTYRTVAKTVNSLGTVIEKSTDQGIRLRHFPKQAWTRFISDSRKARATVNFVDRSRQPRSPESLAKRIQKLGRTDIAIGGVLGAKHYHPKLNMVSAPRLDLTVHVDGKYTDLGFVEQLDPGLKRVDTEDQPAQLVLHFLRRREPFFNRDKNGTLWADPIECLVDMLEARLDPQAEEFESYLLKRRKESSGNI